jgi:adenylate kinase family enzyme
LFTAEEKLQFQEAMQDGKLAPVDLIGRVLDQALRESKSVVVLLDGFPRSLEQMTMFKDNVSYYRVR